MSYAYNPKHKMPMSERMCQLITLNIYFSKLVEPMTPLLYNNVDFVSEVWL